MRHENLSPDTPELPSPAVTSHNISACQWRIYRCAKHNSAQELAKKSKGGFTEHINGLPFARLSFLSPVLLWSMKKLNSPFVAILCCMTNGGCERNAPALARDSETCV